MALTLSRELVVVKFGSDLVANQSGVDETRIEGYAQGLSEQLQEQNIIVVTSGAIAVGKAIAREHGRNPDTFSPSVLAGMGSNAIMGAWQNAFAKQDVITSSILVTHHEIKEEHEGSMLIRTLTDGIARGVVPVVNENDALSDVEVMRLLTGGDNDGLATHVASAMGAQGLRLFTAEGGVYDEQGELISVIDRSNISSVEMILGARGNGVVSANGRGGMLSKVRAANNFVTIGDVRGRWAEISKPNEAMTGENITRVIRDRYS